MREQSPNSAYALKTVARLLDQLSAVNREVCRAHLDTGTRVSEALSLRVESVAFASAGEARLTMPPAGDTIHDLKTGPRQVTVIQCVGALRTWVAMHPRKLDPSAPLFCVLKGATRGGELSPNRVRQMLDDVVKGKVARRVHPHLFRHTRATRAAEAGWNEFQMRAYFGWSWESATPSRYVHKASLRLEERVRADARVDPVGALMRDDPHKALAETIAATLRALREEEGGVRPATPTG